MDPSDNLKPSNPTAAPTVSGSDQIPVRQFTAFGIPIVSLAEKLDYLKSCIEDGTYEDAKGHLDDLRASIDLRQQLKGLSENDLTQSGRDLLKYTEANA